MLSRPSVCRGVCACEDCEGRVDRIGDGKRGNRAKREPKGTDRVNGRGVTEA